jgi:hypothetical protein
LHCVVWYMFPAAFITSLMMEAVSTSEMLVYFYLTTKCNSPGDSHLQTCNHENLVFHSSILYPIQCRTSLWQQATIRKWGSHGTEHCHHMLLGGFWVRWDFQYKLDVMKCKNIRSEDFPIPLVWFVLYRLMNCTMNSKVWDGELYNGFKSMGRLISR